MDELIVDGSALARTRNALESAADELHSLRVPDLGVEVLAAARGSGRDGEYAGVRDAIAELVSQSASRLVEIIDAITAFELDMEAADSEIERRGYALLQRMRDGQ